MLGTAFSKRSSGRRATAMQRLGGALPALLALLAAAALSGCSIRGMAVNALAESLAASGDVFSSDEDPELIRAATPFALKTMETLLAESPEHPGLLLGACRGFTQYAYAFVEFDAERLEETDYDAAEAGYQRALKLYLRARRYCLKALEARFPGVRRQLELEPASALSAAEADDVPLLFWTGASWGAAIGLALDRPDISVDWPAVRALAVKALELRPGYGGSQVHELMMALEALPEAMGGSEARAREHFDSAVELSDGNTVSPYVRLAESVALPNQNRDEFVELLETALAIDPDDDPPNRLANLIAQERARWLLERVDVLFL